MSGFIGWVLERLRREPPPEPARYLVRGTCSLLDRQADLLARARYRIEVTVPAEEGEPQTWEGVLTQVDRPAEFERRFYGVNRTLGLKLDGAGLGEILITTFTGPQGPEREYRFHGYGKPPVDLPRPGADESPTTSS